MNGSDLFLAGAQGIWLIGLLSMSGALLFAAMEGLTGDHRARLSRLIAISLIVAVMGWIAWVTLQAASMADTHIIANVVRALPRVLLGTEFGRVAIAQLLLLAMAGGAWRLGGRFAAASAALSLAAAGLQVCHLHAWAIEGGVGLLSLSALLHIWTASVWLGALLPLRLLIGRLQPALAADAVRRFSRLGTLCVLVLAATALLQGTLMVGGLPGLLGTAYGRMALVKAVLFLVLVAFALRNRLRLAPALARPDPAPARTALIRSIGFETVVGVTIVLAAALLSGLPPGTSDASVSAE